LKNFKELLRVIVNPNKSLAQKIDTNWEDIPGLGGDKLIAKKLLYIFNLDTSLAISTADMKEMLSNLGSDYQKESINRVKKDYIDLSLGEKYQPLTELLLEIKLKLDKNWDSITFSRFLYKCVSSRYKNNSRSDIYREDKEITLEDVKQNDTVLYTVFIDIKNS
jgi:hypothetical protein